MPQKQLSPSFSSFDGDIYYEDIYLSKMAKDKHL